MTSTFSRGNLLLILGNQISFTQSRIKLVCNWVQSSVRTNLFLVRPGV